MHLEAPQLGLINQARVNAGREELSLGQANVAAEALDEDTYMDVLTKGEFTGNGQLIGMPDELPAPEPEPEPKPAAKQVHRARPKIRKKK